MNTTDDLQQQKFTRIIKLYSEMEGKQESTIVEIYKDY